MRKRHALPPDPITGPDDPDGVDTRMKYEEGGRNLIRILSFTIDSLCDDTFDDDRKIKNIKALIASLSALESLAGPRLSSAGATGACRFDTAGGMPYIAVRTCDLERFSVK